MLDRDIGLAGIISQSGAPYPTSGKARIEGKRTVNRANREVDVLTERSEHNGSIGQGIRIVGSAAERLPRQIDGYATMCF